MNQEAPQINILSFYEAFWSDSWVSEFSNCPLYGYSDWNQPVTMKASEMKERKPSPPLTVPKKILIPNGQRKLILK